MDVFRQRPADDDEGQQDHEDHRERHAERRERGSVAGPLQQPPIHRPAREAQHDRPQQRGHEGLHHQQAAGEQQQQDDPAEIPFEALRGGIHRTARRVVRMGAESGFRPPRPTY
jgi:hypothetical protein